MRTTRNAIATLLVAAVALSACEPGGTTELGTKFAPVVYGDDDRTEVYAVQDQEWRDVALRSSVALVDKSDLDMSNPNDIGLLGTPLGQARLLCPGESFVDQGTTAFCSGVLIDDDLVMTAGHCIRKRLDCRNTRFVFRYAMDGPGEPTVVTAGDVFSCKSIVVRQEDSSLDYAIVKLDRAATPRFVPAQVAVEAEALPLGAPLTVIGCPSGIPFKVEPGGWVRDNRASSLDYFVGNNDTFGGNSGSAVWNTPTGLVAGILVRGETDYVYSYAEGCYRVNYCPDDGCGGEESTYAFRAIEALCAELPDAGPCPHVPVCGDGVCDANESTATCPADCGTLCGDGVCNGDETWETCQTDCPAPICGDGICDSTESPETCPADCGEVGCGDGVCEGIAFGEDCNTCTEDCDCLGNKCKKGCCGDGLCSRFEDAQQCPVDCNL